MTTYSIKTTKGATVTRTSEATYVAAAEKASGAVSFHKTHAAAKTAAGFGGTVHSISAPAATAPKGFRMEVFEGEKSVGIFKVEIPPHAFAAAEAEGFHPTGAKFVG